MQNFSSQPGDSLTSVEAQEVLKAWTNRQQAQGVDASVNSVTALAAGLGVSEDDVRKMLEDIRVQQRSQQIASGYLEQEQKHRKRLDITAAIGAGIALLVLGLAVILFLAFTHSSVRETNFNETPIAVSGNVPGLPGTISGLPEIHGGKSIMSSENGTTTIIDQNGIHIHKADGQEIQIDDPSALSRVAGQLGQIKGREAAETVKRQGKPLTEQQTKDLTDLSKQDADLKQAVKEVTDSLKDTPEPPTAPPASGR